MSFFSRNGVGLIVATGQAAQTVPLSGDIAVSLVASRTSGPAPLAVHFAAVNTTSTISGVTDTFRQLEYTFNYGDTGSGTWPISGGSRNSDVGGPLGAHVFETPGTYTVRCTAARGGSSHFQEVTITVTDPDTVYSGTNTVFVSPSANYAGAPAGATLTTVVPTIVSNRRYMLRPGESFGSVSIGHGVTGAQVVAAPLAGAKPIVSSVSVGTGGEPPDANFPEDITVSGFQVNGSIVQTSSVRRLLLLNLDQPTNAEIDIGAAIGFYADPSRFGTSMPWPREVFIVGCSSAGDGPEFGLYAFMAQSAVMGCDRKGAQQHTMRIWQAVQFVMTHNDLSGPSAAGGTHSLKMHSGGANTPTIGGTFATASDMATKYVVIANNVFGDTDDNAQFSATVGPQNGDAGTEEGLEDVIAENNRFKRGSSYVSDLELAGRRMTSINNTQFSGGAAANVAAPGLHNAGLPSGWEGPYYTSRT